MIIAILKQKSTIAIDGIVAGKLRLLMNAFFVIAEVAIDGIDTGKLRWACCARSSAPAPADVGAPSGNRGLSR